jgi:NADPH:quinone reductase-like Zn-dependent oxidoreductase
MKAVISDRYGLDALEPCDVDTPMIEGDRVLVRVHASSVNPSDWYRVMGPYFARVLGEGLRRPKQPAVGGDVAGRVEAVGPDVEDVRRVLTPKATVVVIGAPMRASLLGPLKHIAGTLVASLVRSQRATFFVARITTEDLVLLQGLLEAGTMTPVIDRRYELSQIADALAYLGEGHARGKVVISI